MQKIILVLYVSFFLACSEQKSPAITHINIDIPLAINNIIKQGIVLFSNDIKKNLNWKNIPQEEKQKLIDLLNELLLVDWAEANDLYKNAALKNILLQPSPTLVVPTPEQSTNKQPAHAHLNQSSPVKMISQEQEKHLKRTKHDAISLPTGSLFEETIIYPIFPELYREKK